MSPEDPISVAHRELAERLAELHAGETALMKALPKLVLAGSCVQFRTLVATHLKETEGQASRLSRIAKQLDVPLEGGEARDLERLIAAAKETMGEDAPPLAKDLHLIEAARKIEQAEAAAYRQACDLAKRCCESESQALLEKSLGEEEAADRLLATLGGEITAGSIQPTPSP